MSCKIFGHLKDDAINLKYFLGILNSKLLNYIYQYLTLEEGKIFAEVKMDMVEQLPVVYDAKRAPSLIKLVDKLIDARRKNSKADVSVIEQELNILVCEIFGLSESEKQKVLGISVDEIEVLEENE